MTYQSPHVIQGTMLSYWPKPPLALAIPPPFHQQILTPFLQIQQKDSIQLVNLFISIKITHLTIIKRSPNMKILSPFLQYIPDCKKSMRRLRKKIYKFLTSRTYHKKHQEMRNDFISLFRQKEVPSFIIDQLMKRKCVDVNAIKNLNVSLRVPLQEITLITDKQEQVVTQNQKEWLENNKIKNMLKLKSSLQMKHRQSLSRRSISSTQLQHEVGEDDEQASSNLFGSSSQNQLITTNLNQDLQFHDFERGNSFLQIESILSQQNLFKFQ